MKPVWELLMSLPKYGFNLFAIADEVILYRTLKSEIGRQFLKLSRGLFPFGRQLITVCLRLRGRIPLEKDKLMALM